MFSKLFKRSPSGRPGPTEGLVDGAYRRHRPEDVEGFTELARQAFPAFAERIECFGADWLGRQFAADLGRVAAGRPQVLMLEPGTGEALEIPVDVEAFHDQELVHHADDAVAHGFYKQWLAQGGARPSYAQCVGYRRPLYLGGADDVTNLAVGDLYVYWTISAQLLAKVRDLPPGTPIGNISMS